MEDNDKSEVKIEEQAWHISAKEIEFNPLFKAHLNFLEKAKLKAAENRKKWWENNESTK